MRKIFVDCSYLQEHKELNTGIQRVVRRVIENLELLSKDNNFEIIPVNIANGKFLRVNIKDLYQRYEPEKNVKETSKTDYKVFVKDYFKNVYKAIRMLLIALIPNKRFQHFIDAPRDTFGLNYLVYKVFIAPIKYIIRLNTVDNAISEESIVIRDYFKNVYKAIRILLVALIPNRRFQHFIYAPKDIFGLNYLYNKMFIVPIKYVISFKTTEKAIESELVVNKNDILLLLDSTWYLNIWPTVMMVKKNNAKIIAVIYDLIPITHSQFCDNFLVEVFKTWFYDSLQHVDGYITISNTVKDDLILFLNDEFGEQVKSKKFEHFLLGSDFSYRNILDTSIRGKLKDLFKTRETYLIVCTIEPRKNHKYLLDVFDKLWKRNIDVNLCIVGKIGWKVEETMLRINGHKLLNSKLFHWSNLNDQELLYCYKNSKMLLFPSVVEGFGLPIVESLTNKLPVLASDTPIHREVGQDMIGYFDLNNSNDLVKQLIKIEKNGIPKQLIPAKDYKWQGWYESTQTLLDKIIKVS